ncbi:MAG: hypothetical protein BWK80_29350 [Desulfobacteraceae bacterium IS3]|nr:MAG: hypothetical protein BWK80_29350 [Desulfobacteraceae bacterium IS3]
MNPIGIRQAVQNLPQLIKYTPDNCEETIIVSDSGSVVMIDQHEWKKVRETLRLFVIKNLLTLYQKDIKIENTELCRILSALKRRFMI